ncbi:hypothetical protein J3Q64DRAFT_1091378 [Phycomyces blakesleeanus]|uniref:Xylulose kinase n=2 Tax=Phycomyces blakesleeanus TaxID=4837 RepID=A0A162YDC2_PHYB8|nr:hypothetical protein PHYBLDRAFT_130398 [Phycomyces blakesleeanus NRRL 1555(-)]OAD80025.1 hypothetical protein PHYBLDRAFT_130398 [Phycomyces blakesleeanus NRRL 1555(-)]|eukprot:XP_018298065.1 hypothetical protein PHYBLDRAFT_130398 [Phycomyces blakesleeanus NRRL 1555(-)]
MPTKSDSYYLGLDLSTQQLKCTLIDQDHSIVLEEAVNFDNDLPEFGIRHGAIQNGNVVTSPTLMWVKALDILLSKLEKSRYIGKIKAISGAGQQHGSVYWSQHGIEKLGHLDPRLTLTEQLKDGFSIEQSPIWQDASTTRECRALEEFCGGPEALAKRTGSKAYERFTGNQIAKIYAESGEKYNETSHISLVSSFLASLLVGKLAPVDSAEGSGTNLMNIKTHRWDEQLLQKCGGDQLSKKLALEPVEGGDVVGKVDGYYQKRYGFSPECKILPFTGDNSATLVSMNLNQGDCVISLGTSDTVLVYLKQGEAEPTTESHLMAHPIDTTGFMGMLCYKNGSLTRQHIRDLYASHDWDSFNKHIQNKARNTDAFGFYYWMQEIIPFAKGIYRFENGKQVQEFSDPSINVRAILESQFLSMRIRLGRMTHDGKMKRLLATGGAAANPHILQVLSDVFGVPVYKQKGMNSASLGGALLAKYGTLDKRSFEDMMKNHTTEPELVCNPDSKETAYYDTKLEEYIRLESVVLADKANV